MCARHGTTAQRNASNVPARGRIRAGAIPTRRGDRDPMSGDDFATVLFLVFFVAFVAALGMSKRRFKTIRATFAAMFLTFAVDRKSTRLNSSHGYISYAVFCLKKKKQQY